MAKQETTLVQTKGSFKLEGIVTRLDQDNAYREGIVGKGQYEGNEYRSLKFAVKTSKFNEIFVELFGMEKDTVKIYKPNKDRKKKGETKDFPFNKRNSIPNGWQLLGTTIKLRQNEDGKLYRESLVEFDAVDAIYNNLENGDSVYITGTLEFTKYEREDGSVKEQVKYNIRNISKKTKEIDFEDEKFKEVSDFTQEMVFVERSTDKEENKVYIQSYIIGYNEKFESATFVVDKNEYPDLGKNFEKKVKFGDLLEVEGNCINRVEVTEEASTWGGKGKSSKTTITELRIVDVNYYEPKKYSEDDFVVEELVEDEEKDEKPNKGKNPFRKDSKNGKNPPWNSDDDDDDDEDFEEEDDEDLPL